MLDRVPRRPTAASDRRRQAGPGLATIIGRYEQLQAMGVPLNESATNAIVSTFATVRHRTKVPKGPGSRAAGLAMAFKLIQSAQDHWRCVNAPHLVA